MGRRTVRCLAVGCLLVGLSNNVVFCSRLSDSAFFDTALPDSMISESGDV